MGAKDPLAASQRTKKKKHDDPMGVSQSRKSRKKAPAQKDVDRSVKKRRPLKKEEPKKEESAKKEEPVKTSQRKPPSEVGSKRDKKGAQKASQKEKRDGGGGGGSSKGVTKEGAKESKKDQPSMKYEVEAKLFDTPHVKKVKVEATVAAEAEEEEKRQPLLARPESIRTGLKKCVHMWPTPAEMERLKDKPKPWSVPQCRQTQNLEYFLGRVPQWYIEEKFLKNPGDFTVSRDAFNKFILSVKTKEPNQPCAHFVIEFTETQLVRNDRNYYHRLVGTVPQSNTVQGLIQKYRESSTGMLKQNTKRDAELLTPILPCQSCIYARQEYNYHYVFVRNPKEVVTKEPLEATKGQGYKLFKGVRTIKLPTLTDSLVTRTVAVKEMESQSSETLDAIVREMHIVQTIRFKLGVNTVVNVEGLVTVQKPFHVLYRWCSEGCLSHYLEANKSSLQIKDRISCLTDVACTMYQVYKLGFLHGNLCVRNIFVDVKELNIKEPKAVTEPKKARFYVNGWKNAVMEKSKKIDISKQLVNSFRYLAPEALATQTLNESTEVYAFGLLIYETLVGTPPFKDVPDEEMKNKLQEKPEERPDLPDDLVPDAVQKLIKECTDADPEKRPKMMEVWRALRNAMNAGAAAPAGEDKEKAAAVGGEEEKEKEKERDKEKEEKKEKEDGQKSDA